MNIQGERNPMAESMNSNESVVNSETVDRERLQGLIGAELQSVGGGDVAPNGESSALSRRLPGQLF